MTLPFEPTTEADATLAPAQTLADGFATSDTLVHDGGDAAPRLEGRARTTVVPRVDRDEAGVRLVPRAEASTASKPSSARAAWASIHY